MNKTHYTHELHIRSDKELSTLFSKIAEDLPLFSQGSAQERAALQSLESIKRVQATRARQSRLKPPSF